MNMHNTIRYKHSGLNLTEIVKMGVGGKASVYINTKDCRYKSLKTIPDNNNIKHFVGCFFPHLHVMNLTTISSCICFMYMLYVLYK